MIIENLNMKSNSFLAFDLGASSGRTILGTLENQKIHLKELTRFPNSMISVSGHLHWDVHYLFDEMKKGLISCFLKEKVKPESLAVDTWGVDFSLLSGNGTLLSLPFAYRDPQFDGVMEEYFKKIPREQIYQLTGVQFLPFNSLFQLYALKINKSPLLEKTKNLLFIPDLFNYFFTGIKKTEFTYATTSQFCNPIRKVWEDELFDALGVSQSIMQEIIPPGVVIGNLTNSVCTETGIQQIPVVAGTSHDTGSAVAAIPAQDSDWAFISSGTWSCMGVETKHPIINELALELNFTNEAGVGETFRFLKNISGLWLLEECLRLWKKEQGYSYEELIQEADSSPQFQSLIDPDWSGFLNPPNMPESIREYCSITNQTLPTSLGELVRCIFESLALKYRYVLDQLRQIDPHPIKRIHIIGGGAKNRLLSQFTANATGLPVIAGPSEATATGNIMVQALTLGYVSSLEEMREIIYKSFELEHYKPQQISEWNTAYKFFCSFVEV